jgi:hypothetical protein
LSKSREGNILLAKAIDAALIALAVNYLIYDAETLRIKGSKIKFRGMKGSDAVSGKVLVIHVLKAIGFAFKGGSKFPAA